MRKVKNPFLGTQNYQCFGCSPDNEAGLKLEFFEENNEIISYWKPESKYVGYGTVIHGGIQATLIDETSAWTLWVLANTAGVTRTLNVEYRKALHIDEGRIKIHSRIVSNDGTHVEILTTLANENDIICTVGKAIFRILPEKISEKMFGISVDLNHMK